MDRRSRPPVRIGLGGVGERDVCLSSSSSKRQEAHGPVFVDAVAYVENELRRGTGDAFAMGHMVERPLQFGMFVDIFPDLFHGLARRFEALLEFCLGSYFGF